MNMPQHIATTTPNQEGQRVSQLRAVFEKRERGTVLTSKYHTAPIKIAKAFPLDGPLGVIVMDVSPGLLAGDRYEFDWQIKPGAHAYVTNQSFTKVHPSSVLLGGSSIRQSFELGKESVLESMPEPVMLYRDAALDSETLVRLSEGAVWMGAEVLCPGRTLRGELFDYIHLKNKVRVYYEDELIYAQQQNIIPESQQLSAPGCLGKLTHTGVFYAFADRIQAKHAEAVRAALESLPSRGQREVQWGVSLTYKHGLAVMAAGTTAWHIQETLAAVWAVMRKELLGLSPFAIS
ncbi:urease accessory protein UreD [Paenibacillus sp. DLE-14]|uniref:Urease accessory protein UreD n=2 Tax=Paenibacillus lignilyticus TaxID=1172615 RepID=A0ABS5CMG3_9BACL|nr:urease accessory protein UreD [Paenibacillus lignilyticus]